MKTPETSRLFEKRTDPKTGVEHYLLTHKITRHQQGFYFVNDSMTEDGRYLWFYVGRLPGAPKLLGVIDFEKDDMWFDTVEELLSEWKLQGIPLIEALSEVMFDE